MTRGKWVAVVVGLAAIVLLALVSPRILYEHELRALVFDSEFEIYEFGEVLHSPPEDDSFVEVRRWRFNRTHRRFPWERSDTSVECGWCIRSRHDGCPRKVAGRVVFGTGRVGTVRGTRSPFRAIRECDCPHASHAQDSG